MHKGKIIAVTGLLLTAGAAVAISAPGPRGQGGMWGSHDGMMGEGGPRGGRGWFGPRSITADDYDTRTRERFARLDKNSDGVLDASEIEAAIAERGNRHGHGPAARRAEGGPGGELLRRMGGKDGKVSKDVFMAEATRRFTQWDLNNDGQITDDDLPPMMRGKGILKANGPMVPGPMGRMIMELRQADAKGDGVITRDAFLAVQAKRFAELDRNKDSVVDKADFDAVRKEMTDYQVKRFLHAYGADKDGKVTKDQFFKVAKERFARLDTKGEGKITFDRSGMDGDRRGWFGRRGGAGGDGQDMGPGMGSGMGRGRDGAPPAPPKN